MTSLVLDMHNNYVTIRAYSLFYYTTPLGTTNAHPHTIPQKRTHERGYVLFPRVALSSRSAWDAFTEATQWDDDDDSNTDVVKSLIAYSKKI